MPDEPEYEVTIPEKEVLIPRELFVLLDKKSHDELKAIEKKNPPEYIMRMCYLMSVESLHEMREQRKEQRELLESILKELKALRSNLGQRTKLVPKNEYEMSMSN